MYVLSPEEIRILSKATGRTQDDVVYIAGYPETIAKLCNEGYLRVGTFMQSLPYSDMQTLRSLLKSKGAKAGRKKAELIERVGQIYSESELEAANIPLRYILTECGQETVTTNSALLRYYDVLGSTNLLEPEKIMAAQMDSQEDDLRLLIRLLSERISSEHETGQKRAATAWLARLYRLNHHDIYPQRAQREVEHLDVILEKERIDERKRLNSILGLTSEERERIRQEALEEMGDDWEKELDARNKAKAGIAE